MLNVLGDIWFNEQAQKNAGQPAWDRVLKNANAKLHLYGKAHAKLGRKMAHINFLGLDVTDTLAQSDYAADILGIQK